MTLLLIKMQLLPVTAKTFIYIYIYINIIYIYIYIEREKVINDKVEGRIRDKGGMTTLLLRLTRRKRI